VKKYRRMGSDELPRREFVSCLFAARADFPIDRLPITELRDNLIVAIQNTHLAVEIGTNHPFVPGMKVARHANSRIVLDGLEMSAVQREGLYTPIPAVCYHQARLFTACIHEKTVRFVKLAVAVPHLKSDGNERPFVDESLSGSAVPGSRGAPSARELLEAPSAAAPASFAKLRREIR